MSQEKVGGQLWPVTVRTPQGACQTFRTCPVDDSLSMDEGVLVILRAFLLDYYSPFQSNKFKHTRLALILWIRIFNIALGFGSSTSLIPLRQVDLAHQLSSGHLLRLKGLRPTLFQKPLLSPNQLIEAILHADEKMVRDIITVAPELLLQKGTSLDYQGRTFTGTPLQAAIATGDIAPNDKSTGLVEIIDERLKQIQGDKYQSTAREQVINLYTRSLSVYSGMQTDELARLHKKHGELVGSAQKPDDIKKVEENISKYEQALKSRDLLALFETHNKAQADNAFDFKPYVDAIVGIDLNNPEQKKQLDTVMELINTETPEETKKIIEETGVGPRESDECRKKDFAELTLVQKLNRFREKLVEHMRREVIFNPNHILKALEQNEEYWSNRLDIQDPGYQKPTVIFCQLVGWAQRNAAETMKQDLRQGTYYLVGDSEPEPRRRQSRFNSWDTNSNLVKNSLVDKTLADSCSVGVFGYKFGCAPVAGEGADRGREAGRRADVAWWFDRAGFQNLCRAKTTFLEKFIRQCSQQSASRSSCVIQ